MFHDRPILTLAQVRQWQERMAEIEMVISRLRDEAAELTRKLDAAKVLMGSVPDEEEVQASTASGSDEDASVSAGILRAVRTIGGSPKPATIREWIKANLPLVEAKLQRSPTYLYTAISRHNQYERLIKDGDGYRLPTSSARAETGAGDPGSQ